MARKFNYHLLRDLWKKGENRPKTRKGCEEVFIKKTIDDLCLQADLSETSWEYSFVICEGMIRLLSMGAGQRALSSHKTLVQKLLSLGRDMMEQAKNDSDFFYLGAFVDIKICSKWRSIEFFRFVVSALKALKKHLAFFSQRIKEKIIIEYRRVYPEDYKTFFNVAFSNSA